MCSVTAVNSRSSCDQVEVRISRWDFGRSRRVVRLAGDIALDDCELSSAVRGRQFRARQRRGQRLPGGRRSEGSSQPAKLASYPAHRRVGAAEALGAVALDGVGVEHVLDVERDVLVDAPRREIGERPDAAAHRLEANVQAKHLGHHEVSDLGPAGLGETDRHVRVDVEGHWVVHGARGRGSHGEGVGGAGSAGHGGTVRGRASVSVAELPT